MGISWPAAVVVGALSALAVLAGDLATKALARRELGGGRVVELPFGARLEHGENRGVAFGLLAGSGELVLIVALIAISGLVLLLLVRRPATAAMILAGALLVGGALANLVDRAGDGAVTDFIDLGAWPTFNLADVAITLGVALFALPLARRPRAGADRPLPRALSPAPRGSASDGQGAGERRPRAGA